MVTYRSTLRQNLRREIDRSAISQWKMWEDISAREHGTCLLLAPFERDAGHNMFLTTFQTTLSLVGDDAGRKWAFFSQS